MRISDWSSDVCSSDLEARSEVAASPASGSGSAGSACLATEWSWVRRGLAPAAKTADPAATESTPVQRPCSRTAPTAQPTTGRRSEEHTSELQSLMRISYAVFCLKKKKNKNTTHRKK